MKFKVVVKDLNEALSKLVKIASLGRVNPVLNNVLIEVSDDSELKLTATDLDITIVTKIKADIEIAGRVTLPAQKFQSIINSFADKVNIAVDENYCATISENKSRIKIAGLGADQFPTSIGKMITETCVEIPAEVLATGLQKTVYTVIKGCSQQMLCGVHVNIQSSKIDFVASDGNSMAVYTYNVDSEREIGVIIPNKTIEELIKLCKEGEKVKISLNRNQALFEFPASVLKTSLINLSFPPYKQLIPVYEKKAVVKRSELLQILQRVDIIAKEQEKEKKTFFTGFFLSDNQLEIKHNYGQEEVNDILECEYFSEELAIYFNHNYFMKSLKQIDTVDVVIELGNSLTAALLRPKNDNDYLCLVMPVQAR